MGDVHRYCSATVQPYFRKKTGEIVYHKAYSHSSRVCKLRHPDAAELAQIRAELAAGRTKKAVASTHNLGTDQRLRRLLAKDAAPREDVPKEPGLAPTALSDADVDTLLVMVGWD
jgi:hypothetical protein